mgnify:CR=1 FL=1
MCSELTWLHDQWLVVCIHECVETRHESAWLSTMSPDCFRSCGLFWIISPLIKSSPSAIRIDSLGSPITRLTISSFSSWHTTGAYRVKLLPLSRCQEITSPSSNLGAIDIPCTLPDSKALLWFSQPTTKPRITVMTKRIFTKGFVLEDVTHYVLMKEGKFFSIQHALNRTRFTRISWGTWWGFHTNPVTAELSM